MAVLSASLEGLEIQSILLPINPLLSISLHQNFIAIISVSFHVIALIYAVCYAVSYARILLHIFLECQVLHSLSEDSFSLKIFMIVCDRGHFCLILLLFITVIVLFYEFHLLDHLQSSII